MIGNIVGERFDERVIKAINARQKLHGSGFNISRTPQQIQYLNNRNAWLKMASGVYIMGDNTLVDFNAKDPDVKINTPGTYNTLDVDVDNNNTPDGVDRLKKIGINDTQNFVGNQLAQKTVLFNTLSEAQFNADGTFAGYKFRSGVSKTSNLYNNSAYGLGGSDFGLNPAPGLIDANIECINRGSIRKAQVTLKAFNKFQFELLELVYLRLGYTVMLEWGFDKYIDDKGKLQSVGNTIIENNWFKSNSLNSTQIYTEIEKNRQKYFYHYEGFLGRVTNFNWQFNSDGSYDISLDLITQGDVIESLTARSKTTAISAADVESQTEGFLFGIGANEYLKELNDESDSTLVSNASKDKFSAFLYKKIRDTDWKAREEGVNKKGPYYSFTVSRNHYLEGGWFSSEFPELADPKYSYYMTIGELLNQVQNLLIPSLVKESPEKMLKVENDINLNVCSNYPNLISFDPRVCLIKPFFVQGSGENAPKNFRITYPEYLNDLLDFTAQNGDVVYGRVMNIYVNFEFISECLAQTSEKGEISIFKFLEKVIVGVNRALANVIELEVILKDDVTITIIDNKEVPGLLPKLDDTLEVFGYDPKDKSSNFVRDINFQTEITPDLTAQISIGATAQGGSTKNYDGTAFSAWNIGLLDRAKPAIAEIEVDETNDPALTDEEESIWDNAPVASISAGAIGLAIVSLANPVTAVAGGINLFRDSRKNKNAQNAEVVDKLKEIKNPKFKGFTYYGINYSQYVTIVKTYNKAAATLKTFYTALNAGSGGRLTSAVKTVKGWFYNEEAQYSSNYYLYLVRAFSGEIDIDAPNGGIKSIEVKPGKTLYSELDETFFEEGHQSFKAFINTQNDILFKQTRNPSNQIGFIPVTLGLEVDGISGVKIYNGMKLRQGFLPAQYNEALKFIIKKVNHTISDNDWSTNLDALAFPNINPEQGQPFSTFGSSNNLLNSVPFVEDTGPKTDFLFRDFLIIDNRTENNVKINEDTFGKRISILEAVNYLNPDVRGPFQSFFNDLKENYNGYRLFINAVYRSFERSEQLKQQNPGNADAGRSKHNYSGAIDFSIQDPRGRWFKKAERAPWIEQGIVSTAKKYGIEWGGNFAGYVDSVHFFVPFNINTAYENAETDNEGKPTSEWITKDTNLFNVKSESGVYNVNNEIKLAGFFNNTQVFNLTESVGGIPLERAYDRTPRKPKKGDEVTITIDYDTRRGTVITRFGKVTLTQDGQAGYNAAFKKAYIIAREKIIKDLPE